jgi:hypothetical protein
MGPFYERLFIFKSLVGLERPSFHFKKIATTEQMLFTQLLASAKFSGTPWPLTVTEADRFVKPTI